MDSILSTPASSDLIGQSDGETVSEPILGNNTAQPIHLAFLDGVRGIAAFYVFIYHLWQLVCVTNGDKCPHWFSGLGFIEYGHFAVDVFIVLSGFCLMLPLAKGNMTSFPKGIPNFLRRRAIRILPPYYAALVLSIALVMLIPSIRHLQDKEYALYDRSTFTASILSHIFLVHNLWYQLAHRINAPMWSVATEWQIYFIFAFILLPLRNRMGVFAPIVFGFIFGAITAKYGLFQANFWFVGAFALGMAAAEISFAPKYRAFAHRAPLGVLAGFAVLLAAAVVYVLRHKQGAIVFIGEDFVVALATTATLAYCSEIARDPMHRLVPATAVYRIFSHPIPVGLGRFSYSLYLVHFPLVCISVSLASMFGFNFRESLGWAIFVVIPAIVGISYIFFTCFERPFLNLRAATAK